MIHVVIDASLEQDEVSDNDQPIEPLERLASFLKVDSSCPLARLLGGELLVSPVYMQSSHNDVQIIASNELNLSQVEQKELIELLSQSFNDRGLKLEVDSNGTFFIKNLTVDITSTPLSHVMHRSLFCELPRGDASFWAQLFTEVQMVLHGAKLNQERALQGKLIVNGLWFWGEGKILQAKVFACGHYKSLLKNIEVKNLTELENTINDDCFIITKTIDKGLEKYLKNLNKRFEQTWYYKNKQILKPNKWYWRLINQIWKHDDRNKKKSC